MKLRAVFLATLLCSPAAGALAATDPTPADKSAVLSAIDTDNDGTVTLDEAKAAATKKFDKLDTDKEGTLDASELTGLMSKKALAAADADKDATLDKAEYLALVAKLFKNADTDKDATLEPAELNSEAGRDLVALLAY